MKPLPPADTYERELKFMPYRKSLRMVEDIVHGNASSESVVLDLMCGTGYLLGRLNRRRKDLRCYGVDIDKRYVKFGSENYPAVTFFENDALLWKAGPVETVLCTGALHHIPYDRQEEMIERMSGLVKSDGMVIISDCYIDDFFDEGQRQIAAARLGYEYLKATVENGAPADVVAATTDILVNDVMGQEFKTSYSRREPQFRRHFGEVRTMKVWPNKQIGGYGDYVTVLRK